MNSASIAAWLDAYGSVTLPALQAARRDGFAAVQASAAGELSPKELSASGRRHFAKLLRDLGLRLPSISLEMSGYGLADPATADARIEAFRDTLRLCADLHIPIAEISVGGFEDAGQAALARDVLKHVAEQADRAGVRVAVGSHLDSPAAVARELASLRCPSLGIALHTDSVPHGSSIDTETARLATSASLRDGRRVAGDFEETPLGRGGVDLKRVVATLHAEEFQGPLVIRRTARGAAVDGLRTDREYVAGLLA